MASTPQTYRRLSGRSAINPVETGTLWLAHDHVLSVKSSSFAETYARYYFRDIQAFILRRTRWRDTWNWILILFGVFLFVVGLPFGVIGRIIWWSLSGLTLILAIVNSLLGPTCTCHVRTAVQTEELAGLRRWRAAQRVLRQLQPLIEQAQGTITGAEVASQLQGAAQVEPGRTAEVPPTSARAIASSKAPDNTSYSGRLHTLGFAFLAANGVLSVTDFFDALSDFSVLLAARLLIWLTAFIFTAVALGKQRGSLLSQRLQMLTKAALGFMVVSFVTGVTFIIVAIVQMIARNEPVEAMSHFSVWDSPFLFGYTVVDMSVSLIVGTLGLVWLKQDRRRLMTTTTSSSQEQPATTPPPSAS